MKIKISLLKKLITCLIVIIIFTIFFQVKAEIHYTDVIPDSTVNAPIISDSILYYLLDLNNDGIDDFKINIRYWYTFQSPTCCDNYAIWIESENSDNMIAADESTLGVCTQPLYSNDIIDNSLYWDNSSTINVWVEGLSGCSWPSGDTFLGLELIVNNDTLYGWYRIEATLTSFTIKDYAYNDVPDEQILAGQTSTNIDTNSLNDNISIYSNNGNLFIDITDIANPSGTVTISNNIGQEINNSVINGTHNIIELNNIPTGIYIVHIEIQQGTLTKKFFI